VHSCLNRAVSARVDPPAVRRRLTLSITFCIYSWSSGTGYMARNHWRPCSCRRQTTCLVQSSSRSAPIPDIFYFQKSHLFNISFPSAWLYHWLFFVQSPWSRSCCICLSKSVIITLHYITTVIWTSLLLQHICHHKPILLCFLVTRTKVLTGAVYVRSSSSRMLRVSAVTDFRWYLESLRAASSSAKQTILFNVKNMQKKCWHKSKTDCSMHVTVVLYL